MENSKINFGKVVLKVLEILIAKVFILPFKIYKTTLISLSDSKKTGGDNPLNDDFPVYLWSINTFEAVIALTYPLGVLGAIGTLIAGGYNPGAQALGVLIGTYFMPLYFQLIKELFSITLRMLEYLKDISKN
tara:strand:+ start:412 stop:807 length:396 start_codon:yes stop_codon:yes gene_type:complete